LLLVVEVDKVVLAHSQTPLATHTGLAVLFCAAGEAAETATTAAAHLQALQGLVVEQVVMAVAAVHRDAITLVVAAVAALEDIVVLVVTGALETPQRAVLVQGALAVVVVCMGVALAVEVNPVVVAGALR
jgi:hypothetical protein